MQPVQPVSPPSNQNDLTYPRLDGANEFRKCFEFWVLLAHRSDDSSAGDKIFRQIMSACSLPLAGCCPTSSHTWTMSEMGTPFFSTTLRNTHSRLPGIRT